MFMNSFIYSNNHYIAKESFISITISWNNKSGWGKGGLILSSRCSFSMMVKLANDGKMLVNDGEMSI